MGINGYSKKLEIENVTIEEILKAISDNKALALFNTIALAEGSQIHINGDTVF